MGWTPGIRKHSPRPWGGGPGLSPQGRKRLSAYLPRNLILQLALVCSVASGKVPSSLSLGSHFQTESPWGS